MTGDFPSVDSPNPQPHCDPEKNTQILTNSNRPSKRQGGGRPGLPQSQVRVAPAQGGGQPEGSWATKVMGVGEERNPQRSSGLSNNVSMWLPHRGTAAPTVNNRRNGVGGRAGGLWELCITFAIFM